LRSPIGLDLGALTPEETAVSICAEVIATRSGAEIAVRPLSVTGGPIHHRVRLVPVDAAWAGLDPENDESSTILVN
jgi:hypothetical protein